MTDIVERLRSLFEDHYWDSLEHVKPIVMAHVEAVLKLAEQGAADEIERLRVHNERLSARVKQLHDLLADGNEDFYVPGPGERGLT